MDFNATPTDLEAIERDAALFLERSVRRAERAGGVGCFVGLVLVAISVATAPAHGGVGIFFAALIAFGILVFSAKRATRSSVEDFRKTFAPLAGDSARRRAASAYLQRQIDKHGTTKTGRIARELLQAASKAREQAPGLKRDVAEAVRGAKAKVILEGPPPRSERAPLGSGSAGPAPTRARVEVELPDVSALRERARGAQSSLERIAEALHPSAKATPPPAPAESAVQASSAPARVAPTPRPSHDSPGVPPPATASPMVAARPPVSDSGVREASRVEPRPASSPTLEFSTWTPSSPLSPSTSAGSPASASARPVGAAQPSGTLTCSYCGTTRAAIAGQPSTLCPTCYPQIQLEG